MKQNEQRIQWGMLPVNATGWDGDLEAIILYDPIFTEDFGPIKKGEEFRSLAYFTNKNIVEIYNEDGTEVIKTIKVKVTAVD